MARSRPSSRAAAAQLALVGIDRAAQVDDHRPLIRRRWRVARRRRQHGGGSQIQIDGLQAEDARAFRLPRQRLERGPAEQVFQLTYVTRPVVRQQRRLGLGAQAQAAQVQARTVLFEEVPGQQQGITAALAQWRHLQRVDAEAVIEIGAEAPGAHFLGQVAVGGGEDAHIHPVLAVRAQALQLAALQHAQQLGLHRQRQFTDFVEQQGAAVGQLELTAALATGAGEGAAHMAE
ncbi:hypothetical protein KAM429_31930 [Aquipseudomonas alcaligenes]|uniref:Uncharacterized protein n=1 Tax=Aquipseudomonas alcaligenes TaxID=43263 RepID=A0AA37FPP6_AQUAC|nr:hypothetical protein KAM426_01630 [Pseudomonas alcaligenes]GIZ67917.1 hypothetical protein KAM428_30020 [Pseudomonas alcaligenes]GIZ72432.1 hypothetical protein KAM429_31930 [Pseudomonas alcaligenes]GIZ76851.1 hypothetical protein KAM430_32600 [Pseudomonas alcaligenes]GIZ80983.1 hypothetical protein KAM432_30310 [Pseudomonas alcaligenes]